MDPTLGRFNSRNFSGYLIPSNADIPHLDICSAASLTKRRAPWNEGNGRTNRLVAPAIANAVFHATGRRMRELPNSYRKSSLKAVHITRGGTF